jgi:uncharacterized membrane protein YfhO
MVYAYKLPGETRPAWVATAIAKVPATQTLATVIDPRFDPSRVAVMDTSAHNVQAQELKELPGPSPVKAKVTAATDDSYDIALDQAAPAGSALVVSENYYPGWRAIVDGKAAPVARTNFNLIGIALPTGARTVQLKFTDEAYEKGKVLTLACLAGALLLLVGGVVADRRRPTPVAAA